MTRRSKRVRVDGNLALEQPESSTLHLAEEGVLAALLAGATPPRALRAEDFESDLRGRIYSAMLELARVGISVDPITTASELERSGDLERCGGLDYLGELVAGVPIADNVEHHARLVIEAAQNRAILRALSDGVALIQSGELRPADLVARLVPALETVRPPASRVQLYDDVAVEGLDAVQYLVDGIIPVQSLVAVYGAPHTGKSFAVLDLACSIATGLTWMGREVVRRGPVVYVAAEGRAGLSQRLTAWKAARGFEKRRIGVYFVLEALNVYEAIDTPALLARLAELPEAPSMIIFDTLHRSMAGGDENSAKDLGLVIENVDKIRRATGAAVLLVHHTNAGGDRERGSTSLRGAVDALLQLRDDDGRRVISCEKLKDSPSFSPIEFKLRPVMNSCVPELGTERESRDATTLTHDQRKALTLLSSEIFSDGASTTRWLQASGMVPATFYRVLDALHKKGCVTSKKQGRSKIHTISEAGRVAIALNSQSTLNHSQSASDAPLSSLSHSFRSESSESPRLPF